MHQWLEWLLHRLWSNKQLFKQFYQCTNVISMAAQKWLNLFAATMLTAKRLDAAKRCAANIEVNTAAILKPSARDLQTFALTVSHKLRKHQGKLLGYLSSFAVLAFSCFSSLSYLAICQHEQVLDFEKYFGT